MATLTFFSKPVLRFALLLPFCLPIGELAADETADPGNSEVVGIQNIEVVRLTVRPTPQGAKPKAIKIVGDQSDKRPRRVKWRQGAADTRDTITYTWNNPSQNFNLIIKYKLGVYWESGNDQIPSTVAAGHCFEGVGFNFNNGKVTLTSGSGNSKKIRVRSDNDVQGCGYTKTFFFYDVICDPLTQGACDDITNLDPGTILDNGRPPAAAKNDG